MPPNTRRADLSRLAHAVAGRLPGTWTVTDQDWTASPRLRTQANDNLWDGGSVSWASWEHPLPRAAILSSGPLRLIMVDHPTRTDTIITGALALPGTQQMYDLSTGPDIPHAIHLPATQPARAAHRITARLLPRYEHAVWTLRTKIVSDAAAGIRNADQQAKARLTARDAPNASGEAAITAARNAAAHRYVDVLLAHAPQLLDAVRRTARPEDYHDPVTGPDLHRAQGIDAALARARQTITTWATTTADTTSTADTAHTPAGHDQHRQPTEHLHAADLWPIAEQLAYGAVALARAADHLTHRVGRPPHPQHQQIPDPAPESPPPPPQRGPFGVDGAAALRTHAAAAATSRTDPVPTPPPSAAARPGPRR
ncbi:hypothetical protein VSR01_22510 [Actinacidiphila sp. DG2A-62]|uniref:hypothetical protein n=1 Tax=Actinacidiphila sp. DG2A-62 TaxID=3108821 RepID=UPI002DB96D79|nr:hypothetical protein [Actinacidiphila sp. DG2A-62]MEC3996135.1 hypothetical protein [Actinacidiphila sp. DG2A-62]